MIPKQNDAIVKILKRTTDLYLCVLQHKSLAVRSFELALLHNNSEVIDYFLSITRRQVFEEEVIEVIKSAYELGNIDVINLAYNSSVIYGRKLDPLTIAVEKRDYAILDKFIATCKPGRFECIVKEACLSEFQDKYKVLDFIFERVNESSINQYKNCKYNCYLDGSLLVAVGNDDVKLFEYLLKKDAQLSKQGLEQVIRSDNFRFMELCYEYEQLPEVDILLMACRIGSMEMTSFLIQECMPEDLIYESLLEMIEKGKANLMNSKSV